MKQHKRIHPSQLTGLIVPDSMEEVVLGHRYNRINNKLFDDLWDFLTAATKSPTRREIEDFILLNFIARREYLWDLNKIFETLPDESSCTESVKKIQALINWKCGHITKELFDIKKEKK